MMTCQDVALEVTIFTALCAEAGSTVKRDGVRFSCRRDEFGNPELAGPGIRESCGGHRQRQRNGP